jgi:bacterial leucyl aminopeptidase
MKNLLILLVLIPAFGFQAKAQITPPWNTSLDSVIIEYIDKVNADSIQSYMQALQDMGTRFCLANNRREVAVWIRDKFIQLGYPDSQLDSFPLNRTYNGVYYQTWQYNVVSTLSGFARPDEVYIIGGHHDAIVPSSSNPFLIAPGADDNASGVAAALEVARIMNQYGYQPESTIRFVTFAAEELGLHGGWHYANNAATQNMNIKMMLNNDMISYCTLPQAQWTIRLVKYPNSLWVTNLAQYIATNFTILNTVETTQYMQQSDSWPFYSNGFNTIFFIEDEFTPFYHTVNDLVSSTNKDYAAEVVKISLGMLIYENGPGLNTGIVDPQLNKLASLHPNFPNPFTGKTTIKYSLPEPEWIQIRVFDGSNRMITLLHEGWQEAGSHWVTFNAITLPAGIYFCQMKTETATSTIKLVVSK